MEISWIVTLLDTYENIERKIHLLKKLAAGAVRTWRFEKKVNNPPPQKRKGVIKRPLVIAKKSKLPLSTVFNFICLTYWAFSVPCGTLMVPKLLSLCKSMMFKFSNVVSHTSFRCLVVKLEKSDSKRYLSVFFFSKKIENLQNVLIYALYGHGSWCVWKPWSRKTF